MLVHQLGRGGFAPVWLAREVYGDVEIRRAAVKLFAFDPGDPGASDDAHPRIMEEARLLCRVEHPNIPRFYSVLADDVSGVVGLVMEYVEGASLEKRLRVKKRLSVHETLAIGLAIASALSSIHRAGLVHRDVKPSNIIDAGGTYKLIDFGIASSRQPARPSGAPRRILAANLPVDAFTADMTTFSGLVRLADGSAPPDNADLLPPGTPGYIDPVCVATAVPATPSSDLYALGVTLFECLTGKLPSVIAASAGGGMSAEVLDGRAEAPSVAEHAPDLPPALAALVDSLLSPRREKRPASAESIVLRLERIRAEKLGRSIRLPPEEVGPFRGLGRFEGADRDVYFGRSAEVAATMDLLRRRGLVTLVGASGAGKSSLARAGVAPQVAEDGLGGWIKQWDVVIASPGPRPREAVADALESLVPDAAALDPDRLAGRIAQGAESRGRGVLLVVDQLEELVTVAEDDEAEWLAALLARIADPPHPFVRALAAARRDLLDPLLALGPLGPALPRSLLVVAPMSGADWANAIDSALSAYGYSFEDAGLRDELLAEIESRATAMPLVQFALTELWKHRDSRRKIITRAGLARIGGLSGALERHAEATLRKVLSETSLPLTAVREVLLAMTTPQGTRATRTADELAFLVGPDAHGLVSRLEAARLLVREEDGITLAHDTLLAQWWRLRDWISTAREDRLLAEDIERDAERWAKEQEDPSLLWKKRRLAAAEDLLRVGLVKLSPLAERFVKAGRPVERRARLALAAVAVLALGAAAAGGGRLAQRASDGEARVAEQLQEIDRLAGLAREREHERCDEAARLRQRAEAALSQGRLLRTLRILSRANAQCPDLAGDSHHMQAAALAELGSAAGSDPDALVREGQAKLALGEVARSRLLFDRAIYLLERREGQSLAVDLPRGIEGPVVAAAWAKPDEDRLTVIHGRTVSVLDGATGKEIARVALDSDVFALSPDGTRIALETDDHGVKIVDTRKGIQVRALPAKPGRITALALSNPPERVVTVRSGPAVEVWNADGGASLGQLQIGAGVGVEVAAISEDGKAVALGLSDGTVTLHAQSKPVATFTDGLPRGSVTALAFSPDGRLVAWATERGSARIAPVAADARPVPFGEEQVQVLSIAFSRDGKEVYVAGSNYVYPWLTEGPIPLPRAPMLAGAPIRVMASSPDGRIAAGSDQAALLLLGKAGNEEIGKDFTVARALVFSPRGDVLLGAMDDRTLRSFPLSGGGPTQTLREPAPAVAEPGPAAIACSPDGRYLASAASNGALWLWSRAGGPPRQLSPPDPRGTAAVSFSPDGERALTLSGEGKLRIWSVSQGAGVEARQEPNQALLAASFEPDGKRIVSIASDGQRHVWDAATGQLVRSVGSPGDRFKLAVFSPDLQRLAIWRHRVIELRDTETGGLVHRFVGGGDAMLRTAVFAPDGGRLFAGGDDGLVQIWDTGSGAIAGALAPARRPIRALALSPTGRLRASALEGGRVLLFGERTSEPIATILTLAWERGGEAAIVATPDGHVDFAGANACAAREKVTCRVGAVHLPFEVCEDRFYTPGLLAHAAMGNRSYSEPDAPGHSMGCSPAAPAERKAPAPAP